jgi:hypothetical protein
MYIAAAILLAATLLGPERPVASPTYGAAFGTQHPHALVSDGQDFLAVWNAADHVYAAAVDERGATRPTPPRPLFKGRYAQAAWAGDAYVLAWHDSERTLTARMNRDAQLISTPVVVAEAAAPLAIGAVGNHTLVLVARHDDTAAILLGPNGNVLRGDIALPAATRPYAASVVAAGGGFVVATIETTYSEQGASTIARVTRLSADGNLESSVKLVEALPHNVNSIDAATDGDRVGIAFVARRNGLNGPQRLYAYTVDAHTLAATAHAPREVAGDDPQVVPTPGGFSAGLLEYRENAPLVLTTIGFAGDGRQATHLGSVPAADLRMATNGRTVMSVWRDYRFSPPHEYSTMNMFGIALDATATHSETGVLPVAISALAQARPSIASAGATSLVAWKDLTKTVQGNVVARRVDARGNPLDPAPLTLATDIEGHQQPVVVFTGDVWIVAWHVVLNRNGDARTQMRRIARNDAVLDAEPVDLGPGRAITGASNGTVTLLVFDKWLLRFSPAGEGLGTVALPEAAWGGGLATNGTTFLLAWDEGSDWWQFPSPNRRDVRAIRLDASGSPVDTTPIDIAMSAANELAPVVSSNGTDFLVTYQHSAGFPPAIRAKRVLRTGALADHRPLQDGSFVGTGEQSYAVAAREDGYVAVFAHAVASGQGAVSIVSLDLRGAAIEEPQTLAVTQWTGLAPGTSITSTMVAYSRTEPSLADIERVFVRGVGVEPGRRRPIRK